MKRLLPLLLLLLPSLVAASAPVPYQTTLGAGATQVTATATSCTQIDIQNNATHNIRVGDSTVTASKGILLTPGAAYTVRARWGDPGIDLSQYYLFGTSGDVIDTQCKNP